MTWKEMLNQKKALDLLFPPRCAVCDGLLLPEEKGICGKCRDSLPLVEEPRCFRCGRTVEGAEVEYCRDCSKKKHSFLRGFPLYRYIPPVSDAMAMLKYHGRAEYAEFYGEQLGLRFGREWKALGIRCVTAVPVHPHRERKRGYNQAELIAAALSRAAGLPLRTDLLLRREDTKAQKKLSREERFMNLRAAFQPGEGRPPEILLLVDDIYTTGATADACTDVLLQSGAREVYVTTVCC